MSQLVREPRTGMPSATPHCCDGDVWGCYWRGACSGDAVMVVEQHRRECLTHVQCGGAGCAGNGMRSPVSASRGRLVLGRPSRTASGSSSWIESSIALAVTASLLVLSKKTLGGVPRRRGRMTRLEDRQILARDIEQACADGARLARIVLWPASTPACCRLEGRRRFDAEGSA
jgi:hypothetical protein